MDESSHANFTLALNTHNLVQPRRRSRSYNIRPLHFLFITCIIFLLDNTYSPNDTKSIPIYNVLCSYFSTEYDDFSCEVILTIESESYLMSHRLTLAYKYVQIVTVTQLYYYDVKSFLKIQLRVS